MSVECHAIRSTTVRFKRDIVHMNLIYAWIRGEDLKLIRDVERYSTFENPVHKNQVFTIHMVPVM